MPMLGDLLAQARDGAGNFQPWLKIADPEMAAAVDVAASAEGMTPTSYVRVAISDFARFAGEEDWVTLTSTLKRSEDPGTACLLAMVDWRLTARACAVHSHLHTNR
jgi:hypothetical protein